MLLYPPARAKPGLTLRLRFVLPEVTEALEVDAVLVREARIDRAYGWGVRFRGLDAPSTALLQRFVRRTLAGSAPSPATASRPSTGPGAPAVGEQTGASADDALRPATASYPGRLGAKSYPIAGRRSATGMASSRMSSSDPLARAASASAPTEPSSPNPAEASSPATSSSPPAPPSLQRTATASGIGPPRPSRKAPPPLAGTGIDTRPPTRRPVQAGRQSLPSEDVEVEYQADQPSDPFGDLPLAQREDVVETDPATGRERRRQRRRRRDATEEFDEETSSVRQLYRDAVEEIASDRRGRKRPHKKGWFR